MNKSYVIAAYRVSNVRDELHRDVYFVDSLAEWNRRWLPETATAILNHQISDQLMTWKSRQAAHQWLERNQKHICHQAKFSFPTFALDYEVICLPNWIATPNAKGAPRRFVGVVANERIRDL